MSDFKAKMQQIQLRLGLCPRPRCGSLHRTPSPPPQLDLRGSASKFREESGRERRGREGRGGDKMLDAPRHWKDVCGGANICGSALLQPARSVCVSLSVFFHSNFVFSPNSITNYDDVNGTKFLRPSFVLSYCLP